jgi:hypothetical protein
MSEYANCITCLPQARLLGGNSVTTRTRRMNYEEFLIVRNSTNVPEILINDVSNLSLAGVRRC